MHSVRQIHALTALRRVFSQLHVAFGRAVLEAESSQLKEKEKKEREKERRRHEGESLSPVS
jgi:hypothetical protein